MKKGLVLEGGGMRGLFTAGVIDVMMEHGITYDGLAGVSAGSSFGCNYKSHQPGRVLRYNLRFADDPRYMGLRSLLRTGDLVGAEFAYHILPRELDVFDVVTFERDPMEFYVVCTDVDTGTPAYYRMDKVTYESLEWLRASASMPIVTRPVKVDDGRCMLDGGSRFRGGFSDFLCPARQRLPRLWPAAMRCITLSLSMWAIKPPRVTHLS